MHPVDHARSRAAVHTSRVNFGESLVRPPFPGQRMERVLLPPLPSERMSVPAR